VNPNSFPHCRDRQACRARQRPQRPSEACPWGPECCDGSGVRPNDALPFISGIEECTPLRFDSSFAGTIERIVDAVEATGPAAKSVDSNDFRARVGEALKSFAAAQRPETPSAADERERIAAWVEADEGSWTPQKLAAEIRNGEHWGREMTDEEYYAFAARVGGRTPTGSVAEKP
jgi:hypothetical protein